MATLVTTRLVKDRVLARDTRERRLLATTVLKNGRKSGLIAFAAPSDRLVMLFSQDGAGMSHGVSRTCRDTTSALRRRLKLPLPFARAWFEHVEEAQLRKATKDLLTQWDSDPFREASNLPDLLGVRFVGRYTIANANPLLLRQELLTWWGLSALDQDGALGPLPEAAAAAMGVGALEGRSAEIVDARRAAVQVGRRLGMSHGKLGQMLAISERQSKRLASQGVDPALLKAVELQLGLRQAALQGEVEDVLLEPLMAAGETERSLGL